MGNGGGEARNGELFCGAVFYAVVIINRATGQFSATAYCNLNDCINTYTKATRFIMHVNVCVCVEYPSQRRMQIDTLCVCVFMLDINCVLDWLKLRPLRRK